MTFVVNLADLIDPHPEAPPIGRSGVPVQLMGATYELF